MANPKTKRILKNYGVKVVGDETPSKFAEYINDTDHRVYFIQDFMTISLSHNLRGLKNALYISDIRTQIEKSNTPYYIDIVWNLSQQYNWISILKPRAYLLKFRLPFHEPRESIDFDKPIHPLTVKDFEYSKKIGIDFLEDYKNGELHYLDGIMNLQSFPGVSSTETRLEGTTMDVKNYGSKSDYEDKFAYYNLIRSLGFFENPLADKKLGFDHCGDCALEYKIWSDYADKYDKKVTLKWVKGLINITGQHLFKDNHGHKFKPLTWYKYREDYKTLNLSVGSKKNKNFRRGNFQ